MDIAAMSIAMHQATVQNVISISLTKMFINNTNKIASQMTDMIKNMVVDTGRGTNIEVVA